MLIKRRPAQGPVRQHSATPTHGSLADVDRRAFLIRSGLVAGALGGLGSVQLGAVRRVEAAGSSAVGPDTVIKKNICTHCSVGCTVTAEVVNGVWVGQEPSWASPINRGTHCAKGAAIRELVSSDRRLKYPMKLEGGQWKRISLSVVR